MTVTAELQDNNLLRLNSITSTYLEFSDFNEAKTKPSQEKKKYTGPR